MAKTQTLYVCQECGSVTRKWAGKCEACNAWDSIVEDESREVAPKGLGSLEGGRKLEFQPLEAEITEQPRVSSGIGELDRVLGGGLVKGSAILVGGDPGIGKSTLLIQLAAHMAKADGGAVYISGEESVSQLQLRARRLGLGDAPVQLTSATSVRDIISTLDNAKAPGLLVIDSVQTMFLDNLESAPGTVTQVRASSFELIRMAKKRGTVLLLVGHVTKEGQIAGPKVLEHMVDTVLYFEGERGHQFRILRTVKNRFGGTDEIGVFEMTGAGLIEVANPSSLFLSEFEENVTGTAVFAAIEGSRPLLAEVQALVASSYMASPRRAVVGWDANRLSMLLAVLDTRAGIAMLDKEVYLNVVGGLKIIEPAADLAVVAALVSSFLNKPLPQKSLFCGEVGLSGEVRRVGQLEARVKEAAKLGFHNIFVPRNARKKELETAYDVNMIEVKSVRELVQLF